MKTAIIKKSARRAADTPLQVEAFTTKRHPSPEIAGQFVFQAGNRLDLHRLSIETMSEIAEHRQELRLDLSQFASLASRSLRPSEVDWLRVALFCYAADRLASRSPKGAGNYDHWSRRIKVTIPVADPKIWQVFREDVQDALNYLTSDTWTLAFTLRNGEFEEEQQIQAPTIKSEPENVLLFSGGLDSLAGAVDLIANNSKNLLLVSGSTHNRLNCEQRDLAEALRRTTRNNVDHLICEYGLKGDQDKTRQGRESTQRARGWIHVAFGLLASHLVSNETLHLYENGIGAFNLSSTTAQLSGQNSLSVHPLFLNKISAVASGILGNETHIVQPSLFETKSALLKRVFNTEEHRALIARSFSCERFPNFPYKKSQCGKCPSCLVRRSSLFTAGMSDSGDDYQFDFLKNGLPGKLPLSQGYHSMNAYTRRISSCLAMTPSGSALAWEYPELGLHLPGIGRATGLPEKQLLEKLGLLQDQFTDEWNAFSAQILAA